jgi:hypothetical protein
LPPFFRQESHQNDASPPPRIFFRCLLSWFVNDFLSSNGMTPAGAIFLCDALRAAKGAGGCLETLALNDNMLGDRGVAALAQAVCAEQCTALTHLSLQGNGITDQGASILLDVVCGGPHVSFLSRGGAEKSAAAGAAAAAGAGAGGGGGGGGGGSSAALLCSVDLRGNHGIADVALQPMLNERLMLNCCTAKADRIATASRAVERKLLAMGEELQDSVIKDSTERYRWDRSWPALRFLLLLRL